MGATAGIGPLFALSFLLLSFSVEGGGGERVDACCATRCGVSSGEQVDLRLALFAACSIGRGGLTGVDWWSVDRDVRICGFTFSLFGFGEEGIWNCHVLGDDQ